MYEPLLFNFKHIDLRYQLCSLQTDPSTECLVSLCVPAVYRLNSKSPLFEIDFKERKLRL